MMKQKGFSIINISGLTIGLACSLLILLYIQNELRYDRFHEDADRIFRVGFEGVVQGVESRSTRTGFPLAGEIRSIEGVHSTLRMAVWKTFPVSFKDRAFTEDYLILTDPDFFRFFSFNLIAGDPDSVLLGSRKVVITESAARRYFDYAGRGDMKPLGKTLIFAQGYRVTVTGIAEDPPANSHFHFTMLLSLSSWETEAQENNDWLTGRVITYFKILPGGDTSTGIRIKDRLHQKLNEQLERLRNTNLEAFKKQGDNLGFFIQPLRHIHLRSNLPDEIEKNGSMASIILFACIAVFITLIACINFVNLTTAHYTNRAKEIAVRKSVGANHNVLIGQFMIESYFYMLIAVMLALAIIIVVLAPFSYFTGEPLSPKSLLEPEFFAGILIFIALTGLVAGSYPSFYLTGFNPVDVLRGNLRAATRTYGIRNILVIFQFFISSALIIATLVVYQQLGFIQNADLGFNKSNIVNLLHTRNLGENGRAFKEALLQQPGILSASYCNRLPPNIDWQSVFRTEGVDKDFLLAVYEMDPDHLETMGYEMVRGRFFRKDDPADEHSVILNETAARRLGLTDPVGKNLLAEPDLRAGRERQIVGIIRDFNFKSLKDPIQPMAIVPGPEPNWEMAIRIKGDDLDSTLARIRNQWAIHAPDAAFEYSLVEQNFASTQGSERWIGFLFLVFTVLAIIIACMGLFGLATFTAERKRKQIGIRKVMGATVTSIVLLLNKSFLKLVLIANLIAWPLMWWLMNKWLGQFAYHTPIDWWIFLFAGAATFIIALLSISFRAFSAAAGNPVDSLRSE